MNSENLVIPAKPLDQLMCKDKTLRRSAIETDDTKHRLLAQFTIGIRALGAHLVQNAQGTQGPTSKPSTWLSFKSKRMPPHHAVVCVLAWRKLRLRAVTRRS